METEPFSIRVTLDGDQSSASAICFCVTMCGGRRWRSSARSCRRSADALSTPPPHATRSRSIPHYDGCRTTASSADTVTVRVPRCIHHLNAPVRHVPPLQGVQTVPPDLHVADGNSPC